jgi:signal peptidase II
MVDTKPLETPAEAPAGKTLPTFVLYALALGIALLDQGVKAWVRNSIPLGESRPLWAGVFHLTHTQNKGMAFSFLWGQTALLVVAAFVVMGVIVAALVRQGKRTPVLLGLALALPLGGAIGNLIDRIKDHYVTDFLDFTLIHFPIFNIADSAITVGICLLALRNFLPTPIHPPTEAKLEANNAT